MSTVRKTITLTDQQEHWVKSQVDAGHYTNDSECIRDLIRQEQERRQSLQTMIDNALASGVSSRDLDAILAIAREQAISDAG